MTKAVHASCVTTLAQNMKFGRYGWLGKKNGELLKLMAEAGFELFITVDEISLISKIPNTCQFLLLYFVQVTIAGKHFNN